jgi:hypothetical protein
MHVTLKFCLIFAIMGTVMIYVGTHFAPVNPHHATIWWANLLQVVGFTLYLLSFIGALFNRQIRRFVSIRR